MAAPAAVQTTIASFTTNRYDGTHRSRIIGHEDDVIPSTPGRPRKRSLGTPKSAQSGRHLRRRPRRTDACVMTPFTRSRAKNRPQLHSGDREWRQGHQLSSSHDHPTRPRLRARHGGGGHRNPARTRGGTQGRMPARPRLLLRPTGRSGGTAPSGRQQSRLSGCPERVKTLYQVIVRSLRAIQSG